MWWLAMLGCVPKTPEPEAELVAVIVDHDRPEHFFDVPFPRDSERDGTGAPVLDGFPVAHNALFESVVAGWRRRIPQVVHGYGNLTPAYVRFEGALDLPESFTTDGERGDGVYWVALDGSGLLPLEARFVADPGDDPYWAPNTLAFAPQLGHAPKSGGRYAAVVTDRLGAGPPDNSDPVAEEVVLALGELGISEPIAVASVFTVQDGTAEMKALVDDVEPRLGDWGTPVFKRVTSLAYSRGTTPSGNAGTRSTVTYEDGTTRDTWQGAVDADLAYTRLFDETWPMVMYEAEIPVWYYQGLADRPFMGPGFTHVLDVNEETGWIDVDPSGVASVPEQDLMRIVVQLPKGPDGEPIADAKVVLFDHGTGGQAWGAAGGRNPADRMRDHAVAYASRGWAVVSRDASLYGTRYPLVDEGFTDGSLGFYNIVNLPAFRDNQRQTALEGHQLLRYVQDQLADDLPAGGLDTAHIRQIGHSLGSVTLNLGAVAHPDELEATLLAGSGGDFSVYFLETGLLTEIGPETVALLFDVLGADPPDEVTVPAILAAAIGAEDPEAAARVDRLHPVLALFQWTMDPSDPMALAADIAPPSSMIIGTGDFQVPDRTSRALAAALPDLQGLLEIPATSDYDPHQVVWREDEGIGFLEDWLDDAL